MSAERTPATSVIPDLAEPRAGRNAVPIWLMVLLLVLIYFGMVYFDRHSGWGNPQVYAPYRNFDQVKLYQPPSGGASLERGKAVYDNVCALCHNTDGTGKPNQAPPFVGSEWALGAPARMIRIPLYGLTGPVNVNGKEWNLAMPAMGAALSEEDLAAVLTYIRQSWGNKASEITPDQIKAIKTQVGNRAQPWTAAELNSVQ
jgi:mono/diheme cytochrome c family protein